MDKVLNECLKEKVRREDYFVDGEKIIAKSVTIGKLRYSNTFFDKRIPNNLRKELKANIIANLDKIIPNSILFQYRNKDKKHHSFATEFDRRKALIGYKGEKYEIMFEVGRKDGVNTLYGIEHIKKTKKIDLIPHNK